eukprot:51226-Eustigmatos_ZCMA.PRE.1
MHAGGAVGHTHVDGPSPLRTPVGLKPLEAGVEVGVASEEKREEEGGDTVPDWVKDVTARRKGRNRRPGASGA